jgi:hypothetical protein
LLIERTVFRLWQETFLPEALLPFLLRRMPAWLPSRPAWMLEKQMDCPPSASHPSGASPRTDLGKRFFFEKKKQKSFMS